MIVSKEGLLTVSPPFVAGRYASSLLLLDLLTLRLSGWLPLVACLFPLLLDLLKALRRLVLRFLNFFDALHKCLNLTILENLALSVHFANAWILLLRIVVDDGLVTAAATATMRLLIHESA